MIEKAYILSSEVSFIDYLLKSNRNKWILILAAIASVVQFAIFKYIYPYASYIHGDSFSYLNAANQNLDVNTYMIGYSRFLRFFSVFTKSDTAVVVFQYLLLQVSSLFLLFTVFYHYKPNRVTQTILLCFMVLNPLFLYLGNLISSDAVFAALSVILFTILLWIIHCPSWKLIYWHTLVIFIAFTFRYNAWIYVIIALGTFLLSQQSALRKTVAISLSIITIGLFVLFTGNEYKKLCGSWQYSPFAGWQLANNAMYTYRYVDSANRKAVPHRFKKLDLMIRNYFDATRDTSKFPIEKLQASTFYMWSPGLPLMRYQSDIFKKDSTSSHLKQWASIAPLYKEYGIHIIQQYPIQFVKYFLWPNALKYYAPPVEFLNSYNSGNDSVAPIAKYWFQYKSRAVKTRAPNLEIRTLNFYPILSGVTNVVMLLGLISFILLGGFQQHTAFRKGLLLGGSVWLLNAGFTIFASSVALRFQSFPILLSTIYMALLIDWLVKMSTISYENQKSSPRIETNNRPIAEVTQMV